ncbi:MAG: hypothetical protein M1826_003678 [Phylliscum demangeonii]|nr:MAG: hypothetical protein M1826_003678 [Phylliscum demangeonii]
MHDPTEWIESYRPGGRHPVHMDEVFHHRYRVIRKLGHGSSSVVWLAVDGRRHRYVALKIMTADSSKASQERSIMTWLDNRRASAAGAAHVIQLHESFPHQGPNGTHWCLVFEVMGASLHTLAEELASRRSPRVPGTRPPVDYYRLRFPVWMTKAILRQVLLALEFLHWNEIVHADLQPGNMLCAANLHDVPEERLRQDHRSADDPKCEERRGSHFRVRSREPVRRKDGKLDRWAPSHLTYDRPLAAYVRLGTPPHVKLSDFGSAFRLSDCPEETATPAGLRAPELILGEPFDQSIDIWSVGCLAFGFLVGIPLFCVSGFLGTRQDMDDDHLLTMTAVLGGLPEPLVQKWTRADNCVGPERKSMNSMVGKSCQKNGQGAADVLECQTLEELFHEYRPADMSQEEERPFPAFLRDILQYDPSKRPSASELLQHPWLAVGGQQE